MQFVLISRIFQNARTAFYHKKQIGRKSLTNTIVGLPCLQAAHFL